MSLKKLNNSLIPNDKLNCFFKKNQDTLYLDIRNRNLVIIEVFVADFSNIRYTAVLLPLK